MKFDGLFGRKDAVPPAKSERILPHDVRYALKYREAVMGASEIRDLARNGFENEALYLVLKAAVNQPERQLDIMRGLPSLFADEPGADGHKRTGARLREFVEHAVATLPDNSTVAGMKLAQISRQGFEHWHVLYATLAEKHAGSPQETFLVGHATFVGLGEFMRAYQSAQKPLYILIPEFIQNPNLDVCGYRIDGGTVEFLPKDFPRPAGAIVIDDVTRTGNAMKNVGDFWEAGGTYPAPEFEFLSTTPESPKQ